MTETRDIGVYWLFDHDVILPAWPSDRAGTLAGRVAISHRTAHSKGESSVQHYGAPRHDVTAKPRSWRMPCAGIPVGAGTKCHASWEPFPMGRKPSWLKDSSECSARKALLFATLMATLSVPDLHAQIAPRGWDLPSASVPVTQLKFYQDKYGIMIARAWGDPDAGPHGNYIRMDGNTRSPPHTHTFSYSGVVITGVVSNAGVGKVDRPLPPGSYWFQKGGEPHVTACVSQDECLFFVVSPGPFDFIPIEQ
jgi:hypothetical protein